MKREIHTLLLLISLITVMVITPFLVGTTNQPQLHSVEEIFGFIQSVASSVAELLWAIK
ncbi:MAG: hypothetical protein R3Y67_10055 [Eubacteriales bacterium]